MPDRSIILRPHELLRLQSAGSVVVRRAFKSQPPEDWHPIGCEVYSPEEVDRHGMLVAGPEVFGAYDEDYGFPSPWQPGERLWVKETWSPDHAPFYPHFRAVYEQDCPVDIENGRTYSPEQKAWYPFRWRSPAVMPLWASRFTVVASELRAEQVQNIDEDDAANSGFDTHGMALRVAPGGMLPCVALFAAQWDRDNKTPATKFDANPWVWRGLMTRVEESNA